MIPLPQTAGPVVSVGSTVVVSVGSTVVVVGRLVPGIVVVGAVVSVVVGPVVPVVDSVSEVPLAPVQASASVMGATRAHAPLPRLEPPGSRGNPN